MRGRAGAAAGWVALGILVVLVVLAVWAGSRGESVGLHERDPDDASPTGARAVAEVLRDQGVEVVVVHSISEATAQTRGHGGDTTLLLDDDWWMLGADAYARVADLTDSVLLVQPRDAALEAIVPEVVYAGFPASVADADCELPAAQRAETIIATGDAYDAPDDAIRCFPTPGGAASLVRLERSGTQITVLGSGDVLANETITDHGAAALALGLLGERGRLVWYQPGLDDLVVASDTGTLASRQADWYLPLMVLLLLVGIAAILWRGRRMGPVVVEDLPVEVRASETMEGRARLYERGAARGHAIDILRRSTIDRLARTLGLPRTADDDAVIAATAAATGRDPADVDALLRTLEARNDRAVVHLSDQLATLERDLTHSVRPR
ncbi:DUF4350 domain-containing protein [Homoserinibacter sp. GY 40078]|uniref:DUF4350 domain-containing protein n=1 Tax=Homoserinibacter sp. GY 40078 TaxID=2603275 RepID=UPI0011CC36D7|nr:DUF4350 domain-containing protein [Homoserinibacter sp. GY 40078]TXK16291.1 DUF4350 domain-containing protein [Homoserinibacter sp. GY 40078]